MMLLSILRSWGKSKVHQMGDGRSPFATVGRLHGRLFTSTGQPRPGPKGFDGDALTDSALASSSAASLGRRWSLCCLRRDWLFLAVEDADRWVNAAPKLPTPPSRLWV